MVELTEALQPAHRGDRIHLCCGQVRDVNPTQAQGNLLAMSTLSLYTQSALLSPAQHKYAGEVVHRMQYDGFENWAIDQDAPPFGACILMYILILLNAQGGKWAPNCICRHGIIMCHKPIRSTQSTQAHQHHA